MAGPRWIEIDCSVCGMDYDINDPTDAQWEHPVCEVCGSEPTAFDRLPAESA